MKDRWFCVLAGQQIGPVPFSRLQQLAQAGRLTADDCVRRESESEWTEAGDVPSLLPPVAVTPDVAEATAKPNAAEASTLRSPAPQPMPKASEPSPQPAAPPPPRNVPSPAPPPEPTGKALPAPPREQRDLSHESPPLLVAADASEPLHRRTRKKGDFTLPLTIGAVAAVGVLALGVVLFMSGAFTAAPTTAAKEDNTADSPSVELANLSPDEIEAAAAKALEVSSQATALAMPAKASNPETLLKSISKWNDISRLKNLTLGPATITFTGIWLSATEKGEPIEGDQSNSAKYLVLKFTIENAAGAAPIHYRGWAKDALLVDDAGNHIRAIGSDAAAQRVEPGGSLADTLIFPLEKADFESLRLALPHETVGIRDEKSFAFELPRHALGRGLNSKRRSAAPVAARVAADGAPGIVETAKSSPDDLIKPAGAQMDKKTAEKPKADNDELGLDKLKAKADMLDKMEKPK